MSSQTELNYELARLYIVQSDIRDQMKSAVGSRFDQLQSMLFEAQEQIRNLERKINS